MLFLMLPFLIVWYLIGLFGRRERLTKWLIRFVKLTIRNAVMLTSKMFLQKSSVHGYVFNLCVVFRVTLNVISMMNFAD